VKILQRKSPLKFGSHLHLDQDLQIFEGIFFPLWDRGNSATFADNSQIPKKKLKGDISVLV